MNGPAPASGGGGKSPASLKPLAGQSLVPGMSKSDDDIRRELSGLIEDAVPEDDPARRQALLTLADHWSDILRRRRAAGLEGDALSA